MMDRLVAAIGVIAVMGGAGNVANARTPSTPRADGRTVAIDQLVKSEMEARGIPGLQLAIVQHGKIVFTGVYGQEDIETKSPVTSDTVFPINSISKAFTGVAAMQLVEAGKLSLDAPLATYLDGLPESWRAITVRQVLTHTSGLPEIVDDNVRLLDGAEPAEAWAKVQQLSLKFAAGTKFSYTQTNYVVMDRVFAKLAGSYSALVRKRQFAAVGMKKAGFQGSADGMPHVAPVYTYLTLLTKGTQTVGVERSKTLMPRQESWPEMLRPAGGLRSNATDLASWSIAVQKSKLIRKDSLEQLWKPQLLSDGSYAAFNSTINGYGLGWPSVRRAEHPAISPIGGERGAMFIYPQDDLTIVVLTNLMGASPQKFIDKIAALYIPGMTAGK